MNEELSFLVTDAADAMATLPIITATTKRAKMLISKAKSFVTASPNFKDVKDIEVEAEEVICENIGYFAKLVRVNDDGKQTLGTLRVYNYKHEVIFTCATLELSYNNNLRSLSSIPTGTYKTDTRRSKKYGNHFILRAVPDRSYILIHAGNFYTQTRGCILVGTHHVKINSDAHKDVANSRSTMANLLNICPEGFTLEIKNYDYEIA